MRTILVKKILKKLKKEISEERITENADMRKYTSFRAGGCADFLVEPENENQLIHALNVLRQEKAEFMVLGNGSNVLVRDGGYRGIILKIGSGLSRIDVEDNVLECGSGALLSVISRVALNEGLSGFEFASGIPGSAGGAVFMNAGAYGGEMKHVLESVRVFEFRTGIVREMSVDELDLSYRHSILEETGDVVLSLRIRLQEGDKEEISEKMKELARQRNLKQPVQYPSAGSFFKRPEGYFAGKLVQDAGLKGVSVGGAQVSELHSGFVINTGEATADDIIRLMRLVQNTVYDRFGVMLDPEVRIIGEE